MYSGDLRRISFCFYQPETLEPTCYLVDIPFLDHVSQSKVRIA